MAEGYVAQTLLTPTTEDVSDVFDKVNKHLEDAVRKKIAYDVNEEQKKSDAIRDSAVNNNTYIGSYTPDGQNGGDPNAKSKKGNENLGKVFSAGNDAGRTYLEQKTKDVIDKSIPEYNAKIAGLNFENDIDLSISELAAQAAANEFGNLILNKTSGTLGKIFGRSFKVMAPLISGYNLTKALVTGDEIGAYKHGAQTAGWTTAALTTQGAFSGSWAGAAGLGVGLGMLAADVGDYILKSGGLEAEKPQVQSMVADFANQFTGSYVNDFIDKQIKNIPQGEVEEFKKVLLAEAQKNSDLNEAIKTDGLENVLRNNLAAGIMSEQGTNERLTKELYGSDGKPGVIDGVVKELSDASNDASSRGYYGMLSFTKIDRSARRSKMINYLDMAPPDSSPGMQAYSKAKQDYLDYNKSEYKDPDREAKLKENYMLSERRAYFERVAKAKEETNALVADPNVSLDVKRKAIINTINLNWLSSSAGDIDVKDIGDYGYFDTMGEGLSTVGEALKFWK